MPAAASRSRLLWLAGAAALALAAVLVIRRRSSSAAGGTDTSGRPGPDLTGSAAQQPSGGAASVPGQLPAILSSAPDTLQQQVQQTYPTQQTSGGEAPTMAAPAPTYSSSAGYAPTSNPNTVSSVGPYGFTTYTDVPTGKTFTTDVGGSYANPPTLQPSGSWFEGALPAPVSTAPPTANLIALHYAAGRDPVG